MRATKLRVVGMGQHFRYFAASAEEAADVSVEGPAGSSLSQVELKSVDPVILLGGLVSELSVEERLLMYADAEPSAAGRLLVRLADDDVAFLAGIADEEVQPLAVRWAESEYWLGGENATTAAETIGALRVLARTADESGRSVYAWADTVS